MDQHECQGQGAAREATSAEPVGLIRHAWECMGMVSRLLWSGLLQGKSEERPAGAGRRRRAFGSGRLVARHTCALPLCFSRPPQSWLPLQRRRLSCCPGRPACWCPSLTSGPLFSQRIDSPRIACAWPAICRAARLGFGHSALSSTREPVQCTQRLPFQGIRFISGGEFGKDF